ncbi:MAG: hypothetical protein VCC67_06890 [Myxococcota bacterium]
MSRVLARCPSSGVKSIPAGVPAAGRPPDKLPKHIDAELDAERDVIAAPKAE